MSKQYQLNGIKFSYANKTILDIEQQHFEQGKITALIGYFVLHDVHRNRLA